MAGGSRTPWLQSQHGRAQGAPLQSGGTEPRSHCPAQNAVNAVTEERPCCPLPGVGVPATPRPPRTAVAAAAALIRFPPRRGGLQARASCQAGAGGGAAPLAPPPVPQPGGMRGGSTSAHLRRGGAVLGACGALPPQGAVTSQGPFGGQKVPVAAVPPNLGSSTVVTQHRRCRTAMAA